MIDTTSATASASSTATVCESMALYGAAPERGELDSRVVWDEDDAIDSLNEAIRIIVGGITVDGTQMADEREPLMWGLTNMLHSQVSRLDRAVDRIAPEMRDLEKAQDGSEVKAWELQTLTDRAQNLGDRRDAFEKLRDLAADAYRVETGDTWRRTYGSNILTQRCFLPPDSAGTHGIGPRFRPGCNATQEEYRWRRFASTNAASTRLSPASPPTTFATAS